MVSLHKLHFHVHYEEVYYHKKFKNLSIKILIIIVGLKCKKSKKIGLKTLGVNFAFFIFKCLSLNCKVLTPVICSF